MANLTAARPEDAIVGISTTAAAAAITIPTFSGSRSGGGGSGLSGDVGSGSGRGGKACAPDHGRVDRTGHALNPTLFPALRRPHSADQRWTEQRLDVIVSLSSCIEPTRGDMPMWGKQRTCLKRTMACMTCR